MPWRMEDYATTRAEVSIHDSRLCSSGCRIACPFDHHRSLKHSSYRIIPATRQNYQTPQCNNRNQYQVIFCGLPCLSCSLITRRASPPEPIGVSTFSAFDKHVRTAAERALYYPVQSRAISWICWTRFSLLAFVM